MSNIVSIGRLSLSRDSFGKGPHGKVFHGRFEDMVDVSIVRVDKSEFSVDLKVLRTTDIHPNIVRFYCAEEDADSNEFQ
jgi:serine/threonine protein kinase